MRLPTRVPSLAEGLWTLAGVLWSRPGGQRSWGCAAGRQREAEAGGSAALLACAPISNREAGALARAAYPRTPPGLQVCGAALPWGTLSPLWPPGPASGPPSLGHPWPRLRSLCRGLVRMGLVAPKRRATESVSAGDFPVIAGVIVTPPHEQVARGLTVPPPRAALEGFGGLSSPLPPPSSALHCPLAPALPPSPVPRVPTSGPLHTLIPFMAQPGQLPAWPASASYLPGASQVPEPGSGAPPGGCTSAWQLRLSRPLVGDLSSGGQDRTGLYHSLPRTQDPHTGAWHTVGLSTPLPAQSQAQGGGSWRPPWEGTPERERDGVCSHGPSR